MKQQKIAAGEFKAKCLSVLDEVQRSGREVIITKRGKPVARLLPVEAPEPKRMEDYLASDGKPLFGRMKGKGTILGDIVNSTGERWYADE
jgi:prevent-host-death family protein